MMFFDNTTLSIPLTRGKFALIDFIDSDLTQFKWNCSTAGYAVRRKHNSKESQYLHRAILERMIGRPLEKGEICDHIDSDPMNNTRANLRVATHTGNMRNAVKSKSNKSGYKGVFFAKHANRWRALITVNRKSISLGYFDTPQAAALAYNEAATKYHGEFAKLNKI